jgi:hypothetical protein
VYRSASLCSLSTDPAQQAARATQRHYTRKSRQRTRLLPTTPNQVVNPRYQNVWQRPQTLGSCPVDTHMRCRPQPGTRAGFATPGVPLLESFIQDPKDNSRQANTKNHNPSSLLRRKTSVTHRDLG